MFTSMMDVPLHEVMRSEIALPLQHVLHLWTVGSFLRAWEHPLTQRTIVQLFDTPEQARQAAAVCAAWTGSPRRVQSLPVPAWWHDDTPPAGIGAAA